LRIAEAIEVDEDDYSEGLNSLGIDSEDLEVRPFVHADNMPLREEDPSCQLI